MQVYKTESGATKMIQMSYCNISELTANERIRTMYRLALDDTRETQDAIDSFFHSEEWQDYVSDEMLIMWDDIRLVVIKDIQRIMEYRVAHPRNFRGDE